MRMSSRNAAVQVPLDDDDDAAAASDHILGVAELIIVQVIKRWASAASDGQDSGSHRSRQRTRNGNPVAIGLLREAPSGARAASTAAPSAVGAQAKICSE